MMKGCSLGDIFLGWGMKRMLSYQPLLFGISIKGRGREKNWRDDPVGEGHVSHVPFICLFGLFLGLVYIQASYGRVEQFGIF